MRGSENQFSGRTFFYSASFKETPVLKAKEVINGQFVDAKSETSVSGTLVDVAMVDRKNAKGEVFKQLRLTIIDSAANEKYIVSFGLNKTTRSLINSLIGAAEKKMTGKIALFVYEKESVDKDGRSYTNKNCGLKFDGAYAPRKWMPGETKERIETAKDGKGKDVLVDGKKIMIYTKYDEKLFELFPKVKEYFNVRQEHSDPDFGADDFEEDTQEETIVKDTVKKIDPKDDLPF